MITIVSSLVAAERSEAKRVQKDGRRKEAIFAHPLRLGEGRARPSGLSESAT